MPRREDSSALGVGQEDNLSSQEQLLLENPWEPKSLCVAYVFLLVGGFFGLHHLYLGNTRWYKLYAVSLGFLGIGVILDFFYLPYLVAHANHVGRARRDQRGSVPGADQDLVSEGDRTYSREAQRSERPRSLGTEEARGRGSEEPAGRGDEGEEREVRRERRSERAGRSSRAQGGRSRQVPGSELTHLQGMFSNLEPEVVANTWREHKPDLMRAVEILSQLSDAQRRQIREIVVSPSPL
mmetsp:Transcript_34407/g.53697  ORF Transcript_34407/g.53697 Transcript_34407/m.53697 type:complete len:239 (-) Transcript_34407:782-1498(-)